MSNRDQKKYIDVLKRYEKKMDNKERDLFRMYVKRDKDDEDLDKISMNNLKSLYEKYYSNRERRNIEQFFKNNESDE